MKNLLIVDDHPLIRDALKSYFERNESYSVTQEATNGKEALSLLEKESFDVIILDVNMPVMGGLEFMKEVRKTYPDQRVLVVSMIQDISQVKKMIAQGINGYVLKNSPKEHIITALDKITQDETYFDTKIYDLLITNIGGSNTPLKTSNEQPLTRRESEILKLIVEDQTNMQIAEKLFISTRTVEAHKRNLLDKTGSKTVAGLAIYALEKGLV